MRFPVKKDLIILLACIILYGVNRFVGKRIDSMFLRCYFNDLLAGIAFPCYSNVLLSFANKRIVKFYILLVMMLLIGCFWEYVAPIFVSYATTDIVDLAAYGIGACIYWTTEKILIFCQ